MAADRSDLTPLEERQARLESALIREYLESRGHDPHALHQRTDAQARELLTQASVYAASRLTEVEARAHYVNDLHHND